MRWNGITSRLAIRSFPISFRFPTALFSLCLGGALAAAAEPPRSGLVDLGSNDPRWKGYQAPTGFTLDLIADESLVGPAAAMTFDDSGRLYLAVVQPAQRTFDVWESITRPDGTKIRLQKRRKPSTDLIKRFTDTDHDGRFDASEIVVDGVENPTAILWTKHGLLVATLGRLERWKDDDGDGRFESVTVLLDGFGAVDHRGLAGLTQGFDGYLYLTTGDNENQVLPTTGAKISLARTGGLFRCRLDGSDLRLLASGFRRPRGSLAFGEDGQPLLVDDDGTDGSKLAGVRLIQPIETGDYGWRTLPDHQAVSPDLELSAVAGERPGYLPPFARLAGQSPASLVVYQGTHLPDSCRGLAIVTDPARHSIRGLKINQEGGRTTLSGETTLLVADDQRFCPEQILVGSDSALYILDRQDLGVAPDDISQQPVPPKVRILRLGWQAAPTESKIPLVAGLNQGERLGALTSEQLFAQGLANPDQHQVGLIQRELVERGTASRSFLLGWAGNVGSPLHVRFLGIQGARQFWNEEVETGMVNLVADTQPQIRRLVVQALAWEPKQASLRLVPRFLEHLEDADARVLRELALAIGRHAEANPAIAAPNLLRWLYAHPQADGITKNAIIRGLERLGDAGVAEVALAVRTRRGTERGQAVQWFASLRSPAAVEELASLIKMADLSGPDRATLIRQYADFPALQPGATSALVDWVIKHAEAESIVKLAALETCRLIGNPASALILRLLDDEAESVRTTAMILGGQIRPPGAIPRMIEILNDPAKSDLERITAARSMRLGGPPAFRALDSAYLESESPGLRRVALRSMADADRSKALPALTAALAGPDPVIRKEAIAILGETPPGALIIGQAYLDATLTRSDLPAVLRALEPHESKELRQLLASVKRDATEGASALDVPALRSQVVESGNPWAGMEVFFRNSSRCASCHQVGGKGGHSGPPLDATAHHLDAAKLIEAIQHPGREIKSGYEPARLAMVHPRSGSLAGPLAGVPRQIPELAGSKAVTMPPGLDLNWTAREFADLVAFLLDGPAQACIKQGGCVPLDQWMVAGPFALGADSLRIPLDRFETNRPMPGLDGRSLSWLPLVATPGSGQIHLGGMFALEPSRVYASSQVKSAEPQTAWLSTTTRGAARVYVNGAKIVDRLDVSTTGGSTPMTEVSRVALKAGWNLVLIGFDPPLSGDPLAALQIATAKPVLVRSPAKSLEGQVP